MKICVVVTNYNGHPFLSAYLHKLRDQCERYAIPLIISDNGSTDASIDFLKANGYTYTINRKTEPKQGFAGNVNNGVRYARSIGNFEYYVIASNDIEVGEGLFDALQKVFSFLKEKDASHGLIGFDEVLIDRDRYFRDFDYKAYDPVVIQKVKEIPGFIFIIRDLLIEEIGFMDEEYFMYGEDNDYYTRAGKAGFGIYNSLLPVLHFSEGSSTNKKAVSWLVYRNALLFAQKNLGAGGFIKMFLSLANQVYNPFYRSKNAGNLRVTRNGFFYNNYLLIRSVAWNLQYFLRSRYKK